MSVDLDTGIPAHHHPVHPGPALGRVGPIRGGRGREPVDMVHGDHCLAVTHPVDGEPHGGHPARIDGHHRALNPLRRDPILVRLANLIEGYPEHVSQGAHLPAPQRRDHPGGEQNRLMVFGSAETETHTGELGVVVAAVVTDLRDRDAGRATRECERRVDQAVSGESRINTVDVERGAAVAAGCGQRFGQPRVCVARRDQPHHRGSDDIGARSQEPRNLLDSLHRPRLGLRGVDDTIGVQCQERIDVIGGRYSGRLPQPAQVGGVASDFVRAVCMKADEAQIGTFDDHPQRMPADIAGREFDD